MSRYFYAQSIAGFLSDDPTRIIGELSLNSGYADDPNQKRAWLQQIEILKPALEGHSGKLFLEYSIPRMGRRADVVAIIDGIVTILEFKIGEKQFLRSSIEQVWDYGLDLKNFHATSHRPVVIPVLVSTEAADGNCHSELALSADGLQSPPWLTNTHKLPATLQCINSIDNNLRIDLSDWEHGSYLPTPTIIEAATVLYREHSVENIARTDAGAKNLRVTRTAIREAIRDSKTGRKIICFVTGVPGAGKTLVGLDVATSQRKAHIANSDVTSPSIFLSGNGPLVQILTEALARNNVATEKAEGRKKRIGVARTEIKAFIQNVHHYRDLYLDDPSAPADHVAIFDEAQRAWNRAETSRFMRVKKKRPDFDMSEPDFLISCLDRHSDWATIVCLVGGGQEINRGEAGIIEWLESLNTLFPDWEVRVSDQFHESEYGSAEILRELGRTGRLRIDDRLHLSVSMRSFRAERVSEFVRTLLDIEVDDARAAYEVIRRKYPIVLTRHLDMARNWLRRQGRGSERFGLLASSSAERLKAKGVHVKAPMNPVHWFLEDRADVRSSFFLEDPATEFQVQGLELDWAAVVWDADFRFKSDAWSTFSFVGTKWHRVISGDRRRYLKNAYRVLLTRARQGMIIVVPTGDDQDATRKPEFYDNTYRYLRALGLPEIT